MLFIDTAHQSSGRGENLIDENKDGLFGGELDPLPDDVDELAHRQVRRNEILLLIDGRDIRLLDLLTYNLWTG